MNTFNVYSKMRYLVLLLVAFVAGCASNAQEIPLTKDTVAPTVSFTAPVHGQTAVPINRKVSVAFSEAMSTATINGTTFKVTGPGLTVVNGSVDGVGSSATFTPNAALASSTLYTATITTGAKDLAGNALASNYVFTFTTGADADTTRPTVNVTSPSNTAVAVPVNHKVTVGFSEAMTPLSITTASFLLTGPGVAPVAGTVTAVGTSAVFTPNTNLASSTLYTATITTGAKDLAGNALASNYVFTFTTGAVADTTRPTVNVTSPTNTAVAVPLNRKVTVGFSEAMTPLSITTASFLLTGPGVAPVAGTVTAVGTSAVFTPNTNLANNTLYTATITTGAKDLAGNAMAQNFVFTFTTSTLIDAVLPEVILVNPLNLATNVPVNSAVNATFNKDMDPLTVTTANFTLQKTGPPLALPVITGTVVYNNKMATFTPTSNLDSNTSYTATVTTGARDLAANGLAVDYVWSFTTGAVIVPPVTALIDLGSAGSFGIMATSAITNTGAATMVNGDVSLDPGTSNGLLPVQVNGTIHINDSVSALARIDLLAAYNAAVALPPGVTVPGGMDLGAFANGGLPGVLPPGTYTSGSTMLISTPLTLDAKGDANASWVFQIGSSLTTTNSVSLINGAQAKNVYWVPAASATVGVGTIFNGNIIAGVSATGQTGAVINGRILAGATNPGTIALDTNTVNVPAP